MNQTTYNIAKELIDFSYWGDTPWDQIPLWELRDILSHLEGSFNLSAEEDQLVNDIVANINADFSWNSAQLTIAGEAKVQQLLALQGRNLRCFDLNTFPTSTQELNNYLDKHSLLKKYSAKVDYAINSLKLKLRELTPYMKSRMIRYALVVCAGLVYVSLTDPSLLLWAVVTSYILCNCITITIHEYWVHDLLQPRNRVVGFILDYLGHILYNTERLEWRYRHSYHHRHWKTEKDLDKRFKLTSWWVYLLFGIPSQDRTHSNPSDEAYNREWPTYRANNLKNLLPETRFLEQHATSIKWFSHLAVLLIFGFTNWIVFFAVQIWLFQSYILGFNELVTHHNTLTREQEADHPGLFLICCGTAYHNTHHYNRNMVVLGPGWVKYVNMQYYFIKLFYRINPTATLS